jgi:hypothetical protein
VTIRKVVEIDAKTHEKGSFLEQTDRRLEPFFQGKVNFPKNQVAPPRQGTLKGTLKANSVELRQSPRQKN